jgi:hypothetical protein
MADEPIKTPAQATPDATVMTSSDPKPTDGKPAGDPAQAGDPKPGDAKPKEGEQKKPEGAPEKYAAFKMPEGYTVQDESRFNKFLDAAKSLNISQEGAQRLIDLAIENSTEAAKAGEAAKLKEREGWVNSLKSDPEIGGQNFEASVQYAKRAMKQFGNEKFIAFLNESGTGDHPEVIRVFTRIGKAMSEDKFVDGKPSGTPEGLSAAELIYGKK